VTVFARFPRAIPSFCRGRGGGETFRFVASATLIAALATFLEGALAIPAKAENKAQSGVGTASPNPNLVRGATLVLATTAPKPTIKDLDKDRCFLVREIEVRGIDLIRTGEVREAVEPLAWHCVGNALAKALVGAINDVYSSHGYVTTQGYVPQQNIKGSQKLIINVVVGRVAKILQRETNENETFWRALERAKNAYGPWDFASGVSGMANSLDYYLDAFQIFHPDWFPNLKTLLAAPIAPGDPLDLNEIQQGLDQLNRAPSHKASAKLEPGAEPATSNVIVNVPDVDAFRMSVGYDLNGRSLNRSSTTTQRAHVDFAKDNLFGLNESWIGTFAGGVNVNEVRTTIFLPVRWTTFSFTGGYSENLSQVSDQALYYTRKWDGSINASVVLARDRSQSTSVETSLAYRHYGRWINDTALLPQIITVGRMGTMHTRFLRNAQLSVGAGLNLGLDLFGSTPDPQGADYSVPTSRFVKVDGVLSYLRALPEWGSVRLDVFGQWADKALYQDDQIVFGSVSTIRGFSRAPGFVDRGLYARFEIAPNTHVDDLFGDKSKEFVFAYHVLRGVQPFAFFDSGVGRNIATAEHIERTAIGGGMRYSLGRLTLNWMAAAPLSWRKGYTSQRIDQFETYMSVSFKLL
jgi:hemolysin activation/secretion protein